MGDSSVTTSGPSDPPDPPHPLRLDSGIVAILRRQLPEVAGHTIAAITEEVPGYAGAFGGRMGETIENAVQMALAGFLRVASQGGHRADPGTPLSPMLEAAYSLGRGEARNGRSADALLSAYRIGARVAWRELASTAVEHGIAADVLADFAEMVFAYIDELSAASVAGHSDEVATSGRVRERHLERLALALLRGDPPEAVQTLAERADWTLPRTLTVALVPESHGRSALTALDPQTLLLGQDLPAAPHDDLVALLVPGGAGRARATLLARLADRHAVVGPARPWQEAAASYARAVRAVPLRSGDAGGDATVDTEQLLAELVLTADTAALADLQARALAPMDQLTPTSRAKLEETLRSWLLHQGRRDEVAEELFVHAQTVRYRMGQLRDLYGDRLDDPRTVLELTLALGVPTGLSAD